MTHFVDSISTAVQGTTMDSRCPHLKKKNRFISFEMFLFPIPFPHFHSEVTTIPEFCVYYSFAFLCSLSSSLYFYTMSCLFTCFWTLDKYEGIILFVWGLTSFALRLFCSIHIFAYTCDSSIFTHSAHCAHILLVFIWFTLNCLLLFSMVLFLLFPYSELNTSSFFSIHNLAIVAITLWGPRFVWGMGKTFQILPPSEGFGTGPCDPGSRRVSTPKLKLTQSDKRPQGQDSFTVIYFSGFLISLAFLAS